MSASVRGSKPSAPDAVILKLALAGYRARLLEVMRATAWCASAHFELEVRGVPGTRTVALFVWPEPLGRARRIAIDVVRLDETTRRTPICFAYELTPAERPSVEETPPVEVTIDQFVAEVAGRRIVVMGPPEQPVRWTQILPAEAKLEREVQQLEKDGTPVFATVDTRKYCYRMTCTCGRVRYAKANSLHQIFACRVCTRADRLRKRALRQYRTRYARKRRRRR